MAIAANAHEETRPQSWAQQPEEAPMWYSRFVVYLELGSARIIMSCMREVESNDSKQRNEAHAAPSVGYAQGDKTLFVCVGPDRGLMLDLAVLRAVRVATGLKIHRLLDASREGFAEHLRRERGLGRPVELLHLALHASPEGVQFSDGVADGAWLSERLLGVRILLLAGCEGDHIGDWLGVVPHVVTLREEICHHDAALLTQHFWHGIGMGLEPGAAMNGALARCPPAVGEYVVRHW